MSPYPRNSVKHTKTGDSVLYPSIKMYLFSGDTLFIAGCGRFFEGTAEQMYEALITKLGSLPDETQVYCGHEYTEQNLRFAQHVENDNVEIAKRIQWAKGKRNNLEPTVSILLTGYFFMYYYYF